MKKASTRNATTYALLTRSPTSDHLLCELRCFLNCSLASAGISGMPIPVVGAIDTLYLPVERVSGTLFM